MRQSQLSRISRVLTAIAFSFIAVALGIIAVTPSASGYEISIYDAYPWYFWFLIMASISCGIYILVNHAFAQKEKSQWWIGGLLVVIVANLIVILLPIFRGYFVSAGADEISHLGMIKDITLTGHVGNSNYYPISHILAFEFSRITGLDLRLVIKVIPAVFYLIYMAGLYLLTRTISKEHGQPLLVLAFGSVLSFTYFNYLFLPTAFFLYLIPIVLMLFVRRISQPQHRVVFLLMLLPMPFLHPLGSLFLVAVFLIFGISILIRHFLVKRNRTENSTIPHLWSMIVVPASVISIIFSMWFSVFAVFRHTVNQAYQWFLYGRGTPPIETIAEQLQRPDFGFYDFVDLLFRNYGHNLLFVLLSLVAILIVLKKMSSSRDSLKVEEIFFSLMVIVFGAFFISTLLGAFILTGRSQRIFCWALMASVILNGLVFHEWIARRKGSKKPRIFALFLVIIIIISATIGVFSVYWSPHIRMANPQVTRMDWDGMAWFFEHKNSDMTIYFDQLPFRTPDAMYGVDAPRPQTVGDFLLVPSHLGYDQNETLADSLDSSAYLVIRERTRSIYTIILPGSGRITVDDLENLYIDQTVRKIYSNGELETWQVTSSRR